ncbi:MAG: TonB-dependent receptor [Bacteroidota bacterium]
MLRFFLSLGMYLAMLSLHAQVSGHLVDPSGEPVPFANVLLLDPSDSSMIAGQVSDLSGHFQIDVVGGDQYLLSIGLLGFKNWYSYPFVLDAQHSEKDFGTLTLEEDVTLLQGVEVTSERMQIEQTIEGTIVNVQSSMASTGSTALQVLERAPGVVLDRRYNNLTLNGQSGTLIMVNGRPLRMSQAEIVNMLSGMSADNLESVELLTNPSAKYDVDGGAGIINLKLKKNEEQGINGSVAVTGGYGWGPKETFALSLNRRDGGTNYYMTYALNHDDSFSDFDALGYVSSPVIGGRQDFHFINNSAVATLSHNAQLGFEHDFDKGWVIGLNSLYNQSTVRTSIRNDAAYFYPNGEELHADIQVQGRAPTHNLSTTLFAEKALDKGGKLSADVDYLIYRSTSPTQVESGYLDERAESIQPEGQFFVTGNRGESVTDIRVAVAKLDYSQQLSPFWRVDAGAKGSLSQTENDAYIDRWENDQWVRDHRNVNDQEIIENIGAAYVSFNYQLDSATQLTAGVRYEHWQRDFSDNTPDSHFGKFFPSVFLSRTLSEHGSWQMAYNRRITRPGFGDLTTFLRYNGPFSVFTGTPSLRPAISDHFKVSYSLRDKNFALLYSYEANPIARYQVVTNKAGDLNLITPQNLAYIASYGVQSHVPVDLAPWWTLTLGGTFHWRRFEVVHTVAPKKKSYLTANLYGSQEFTLPQNIQIELSGFFNAAHYNGSVKNSHFGMLNAGVKKELGHHSSLQFTVTDLLKTMKIRFIYGELTQEAWDSNTSGTYHAESANNRIFKLTYFKRFGDNEMKGRRKRKLGAEEERNRMQ